MTQLFHLYCSSSSLAKFTMPLKVIGMSSLSHSSVNRLCCPHLHTGLRHAHVQRNAIPGISYESHMSSATGMRSQALANDPAFQRTAKGVYTLRALAPEINSPVPQPKTKGQRTPRPPPPRFDPSALTPEPSAAGGLDNAGGDDAVPLDFLDGSSVLAPMPAGTRPEDAHIEAEYIEPVKEEAPENVSSASPNILLDDLTYLQIAQQCTQAYRRPCEYDPCTAQECVRKGWALSEQLG